jgi:voltage-gated potassium channel
MLSENEKKEEDNLFQSHAKELSSLFRFYQILALINDFLLIPMFASIIIENFEHSSFQVIKTGEQTSNTIFCTFFFMEWLLGLLLADRKLIYLRAPTRILDLISCLPLGSIIQGARVLRIIRVVKVFRVIARAKNYKGPGRELLYVLSTLFAVTFSSSYIMLLIEGNINPHFENIKDGLWWSFVTISSVGYGDKIPVTDAGRFVAIILMLVGVGVCGYIAAWFMSVSTIEAEEEEKKRYLRLEQELAQMHEKIDRLSQNIECLMTKMKNEPPDSST